jgi:ABC-type dipeptide/oligopeptide/nickel transport system permease subunit
MTDLATGAISQEPITDAAPARSNMLRRLLYHRTFVIGAIGLTIIALVALCAPILAPHDPMTQDLANGLAPPFWGEGGTLDHPLGTDTLGRDVASRLMFGARNSLVIAFFAVLLASVLGLAAGLSAGFSRGWWDPLLMRFGDIQLAFPFILLAIVVLGVISDRKAIHLISYGIPPWICMHGWYGLGFDGARRTTCWPNREAPADGRWGGMSCRPWIWSCIAMLDFGFVILLEQH